MAEPSLVTALFPGALDVFPHQNNSYKYGGVILATDITIDATSIGITLPSGKTISDIECPSWWSIDEELIWAESVAEVVGVVTLQNCQRGRGDSTAAVHYANSYVRMPFLSGHYQLLSNAIEAIESYVLGGSPTPITKSIGADPFVYEMTGYGGYKYKLTISVETSGGAAAMVKSYVINHWNVTGRVPQSYEGELFETTSSGIDIQVSGIEADNDAFDITVTGANGGQMKVSVSEKVAI